MAVPVAEQVGTGSRRPTPQDRNEQRGNKGKHRRGVAVYDPVGFRGSSGAEDVDTMNGQAEAFRAVAFPILRVRRPNRYA